MKITKRKLRNLIIEALQGQDPKTDIMAKRYADKYLRFIRNHPPSAASLEFNPMLGYYIDIQTEWRTKDGEYEYQSEPPIIIIKPDGSFVDHKKIVGKIKWALGY